MDRTAVLIVAASGRALAASARRGGFVPLVADFFADQDTVAVAHACRRLESGLHAGMQAGEVLDALAALADGRRPAGIVCGTGFEDRTGLLAQMAERWPLLGNAPEVVARVKDPLALAALCRDCGIPHPDVSPRRPADARGWLVKRRGGAGGRHVSAALSGHETDHLLSDLHESDDPHPSSPFQGEEEQAACASRQMNRRVSRRLFPPPERGRNKEGVGDTGANISNSECYFQRHVAGAPVSALILAGHGGARVLGFSAQWAAPAPQAPFRYGGAVTPAPITAETADTLAGMIQRLVAAVPLVGLNSVDFLVADDAAWLLEINPRPGATLDLFEPEDGSLFQLHVEACRGVLPARVVPRRGAAASAIVYADHDIPFVPAFDWPDWAADRPQAGIAVKAGEPLCTVTAAAATADQAKRLVGYRIETILARMCEKVA